MTNLLFFIQFVTGFGLGSIALTYKAQGETVVNQEFFTTFSELLENLDTKTKTFSFRISLGESETILDEAMAIKDFTDIGFSCANILYNCTISARKGFELVITGSNLTFSGLFFRLLKEDWPSSQLFTIINASANFLNCRFENKIIETQGGAIFALDNSVLNLTKCKLECNIVAQNFFIIKAKNHSMFFLNDVNFEQTIISNFTGFIFLEDSLIKSNNCNFSKICVKGSLPSNEDESFSFIYLSNSFARFLKLRMLNVDATNMNMFTFKNAGQTQPFTLEDSLIQNLSIIKGQLLYLDQIKAGVNLNNIALRNCIFTQGPAFELLYIKPAVILVTNITFFEVYFDLCFRIYDIYSMELNNIHFLNTFLKNNINFVSDSFVLAENFDLIDIRNCTVDGYVKRLPALVFKISGLIINGKILISKSSFRNTLINNDSPSSLGTIHGGVLSFYDVKDVQLNEILFKNNTINISKSVMGSAAIYFDSQEAEHNLLISKSMFISNQVLAGPYVLTSFSYRFELLESFIGNTYFLEINGTHGLALIKIACSIVNIEQLKTFNNTFTDGLINIIERFSLNRVIVKNLTAINNTASKRGSGSLLLDGSSKNRVVLLENSLFINNAARTQNAAGIHMFHTTLFIVLNVTYSKCNFFHNFASLGTSWWLRVAKKTAFLSILDCEIHSSETFRNLSDFAVAYSIGAEKGSLFTVRNCLLNKSVSKTYGFYVKDLLTVFDNVTIINQTTLANYSSLFKVEGIGMILQNCVIMNQSSKSIYFNVRDNATLEIINTTIWNVITKDCWFFGMTKSRLHLISSVFYNISIDSLFKLLSSGEESPNVIENCVFTNLTTDFMSSLYSSIIMIGNKFSFMKKNIFTIDTSNFFSQDDKFSDISCSTNSSQCILKASLSTIIVSQTQVKRIVSLMNEVIYYVIDSKFLVEQSKFLEINTHEGKGLINSKNSNVSLIRSEFFSVFFFVANCYKGIATIVNNTLTGFDDRPSEISFFFFGFEPSSMEISGNKFKRAILSKAAINIIGSNDLPTQISFLNNYFEGMESPNGEGSCLNTKNVDLDFNSNVFIGNKAKIGGAAFVYCEFQHSHFRIRECSWNFTNNTFNFNQAEISAGAIKWSFIPPLNEKSNKYYSNIAKNGLEFQSFECAIVNKNLTALNSTMNMTKIENQSSGGNLQMIVFDVVDTYGQSLPEFEQLTVEALPEPELCAFYENVSACPFQVYSLENLKQQELYTNMSSIYNFRTPSLFGRTLLIRNKTSSNPSDVFFDLNSTYINASPGFYVFINISSPNFFFHKKNISKSKLFSYFNSPKCPMTPNEIRNPTSYSYIIPVFLKICGMGEYFESEKNLCELCRMNSLNYKFNQTQCKPCLQGLTCNGGMDVLVKAGFWRKHNLSENIFECDKVKSSCLGGSNSQCGENFEGQLCSSCVQEISKPPMEMNYSVKCKECPPTSSLLFVSISFFLILFAATWIFARFFFENQQNSKRQMIVKGLINYFHTFILLSSYNLDANFVFESYLVWVNRISQGVSFWFSMECISKFVTDSSKFSYRFIFELTFFHCFILIFLYMRHKRNKKCGFTNQKERMYEEIIFIWYFFYPSVLDYLVRACMCVEINDHYYLLVSLDEKCKLMENVFMIWFDVFLIFLWTFYGPYHVFKVLKEQKVRLKKRISSKKRAPRKSYSMSPNMMPKLNALSPPNRNILLVDYKEKFWHIEAATYIFKLIIFSINASNFKGEIKLLTIWPLVFYFQIFEISKWDLFNLSFQRQSNLLTLVNFLLLSYGCLWLTIDGYKSFSDVFFFLSFFFQVILFKIMFSAYGHITIPKFLLKKKNVVEKIQIKGKSKNSVSKGNFFSSNNDLPNSNSYSDLSSLKKFK